MSDIASKTANLKRVFLPVTDLHLNDLNPNKMTDAEFNMLASNMEKVGFVDPLFVRQLPDGKYRVIGGHHRLEVAKLYGLEEVPCTVIDDPDFDEDQEKFQVVRMNVIRGRMTPDKFLKLYESLNKKYESEVMADAFGFVDEDEFNKLIGQMSKTLPNDLQKEFKLAAQEIKTIDGLAKLLNSMFAKYGNTLPYGYMIVDYGNQDSLWLRMNSTTKKAMLTLGKRCIAESRTMDDLLGSFVRELAEGKHDSILEGLILKTPAVVIPDGYEGTPSYASMLPE